MGQPYLFGVQVETVGLLPIELIAQDGTAQPVLVGTVHPQLVRAAGMGVEGDKRQLRMDN
jgi:hypothetical protein